jgi:hypothetical protein
VGAGSLGPLPVLRVRLLNTSHFNQCFFWGAKFGHEKYEFQPIKRIFHGKNGKILTDFGKKKRKKKRVSNSPNFYDKFQ